MTRKWEGCSVLIVEDCIDHQGLLIQMVTRLGFVPSVCDGGQKALEYLSSQKVDLIISDIQMAGGSGLWLLEQMRNTGDQTPLLLITAAAAITQDDATSLGAKGLLKKPFDTEALKGAISSFFMRDSA